jgi:hypothetical protein
MSKVKWQVYSCSNFLKLTNSIKNKNNRCQSHASKVIVMIMLLGTWLDSQSPELIPLSCRGLIAMSKVKWQVYSCSNFLKLTNSIKNKNNGCQSHTSKCIAMLLIGTWHLTWRATLELIHLSCLGNGRTIKVKCQVYSWSNFQNVSKSIKNNKIQRMPISYKQRYRYDLHLALGTCLDLTCNPS